MKDFLDALTAPPAAKLLGSILIVLVAWLAKRLLCTLIKNRVSDLAQFHRWRRTVTYTIAFLALILVGRIWVKGVDSFTTFLGLVGAGFAVAMHDTIANLTGWVFIMWRKPFRVGDRIQIGDIKGDVIDTRLFEFSMVEIGNWVDSEQSTGRIVHVPNGRVLREPLANYEMGFEYIWNEIPVLITFESNWQKAKALLEAVATKHAAPLSEGFEAQIRRAAMKYLIYFQHLTPIIYTSVRNNGVLLTIRYIVKPRNRRGSEHEIWEAILKEFAQHDDVEFAYPTTRFYTGQEGARRP